MTADPISPADLTARLDALEAAGDALRAMDRGERIAAIGRVATRWLEGGSPWRRRALEALPRVTGYAPGAVSHALDALWTALSVRAITTVARHELDDDARAPERLALHSLAGNVPGAGLFGVVAALVAGVPSIVKVARREPRLPALVAEAIAAEEPRLAAALAVAYWPGGSDAHEAIVAARSTVVLAYGRDETLQRLAARAPKRLLRFGPRLSIALVCREAADARTAAAAARQVALYDQQGCLSPQYLLLEEEDAESTAAFLTALTAALRQLAVELPRAPLTLEDAAHAWRFLERHRWREQEGAAVRVLADADATFSVVSDRSGALPASPLNRHLVVLPVPSLADAAALAERLRGAVEAVGLAAAPARLGEAASVAAACGAHRMCPLERLQSPPFAWRQSGHARLASFLVDTRGDAREGVATPDTRPAADVREHAPATPVGS